MLNIMMFQRQNGQVLLIVILVIITASTIGLSLASRSIVSLRNSSEEAESQEALAAAEAGVEQAIQGIDLKVGKGPIVEIPSNSSSYTTEVVLIDSSNFLLNAGNAIPENEGIDIWFAKHNPASGDIEFPTISMTNPQNFLHLYWGSASEECGTSNAPAAIQAIVVSRGLSPPNEIKSYRYAYDGCTGIDSRQSENKLTPADSGNFSRDYDGDGKTDITFKYRTPEGGSGDLGKDIKDIVFMRITPLYKDTVIGFSACDSKDTPGSCTKLPSQGYVVSSTGISGLVNRKITVFKGYPQIYLPYISYGLFVGED